MHRSYLRPASPRRQRGQVLILVGFSLIVLIGAVGLAIDSGRAYGVKARLNAAVDAAAIAGARALATGVDDATRIANAQAAAVRFYNLNYPEGFLGSTRGAPSTTAVHESTGHWRITVSGSADMPTTFIRVLGPAGTGVAAMGEAIRRDLDVMLVMDTSGSLSSSDLATLKSAAINDFVNKFSAGAGGDRVGLVSFSSGAVIDAAINKTTTRGFNRTQVNNAINALPRGGATASAEGMRKAVSELDGVPADTRSSLRVVLFFSDGAPNVVNGAFPRSGGSPNPITGNLYSETSGSGNDANYPNSAYRMFREDRRNLSWGSNFDDGGYTVNNITRLPTTGGSVTVPSEPAVSLASYTGHPFPRTLSGSPPTDTRCNVNRAARNMVENIANIARGQEIRIYTIGLGDALNDLEPSFSGGNCGYTSARERGSNILKRLANTADADTRNAAQPQGLYCFARNASELGRCFSTIASEILRLTL
ncbi:MAG: VWA domain-containing protein [Burkholderiaceae bacterium]|nr:VWA domain-containing protein [Burkholderiaceae bacterium]